MSRPLPRRLQTALALHGPRALHEKLSGREHLPAPMADWLTLEQRHLSRAVDTGIITSPRFNNQDDAYLPESGRVFPLRTYWVPADRMRTFEGAGLESTQRDAFVRVRNGKVEHRLVVHPESQTFYASLTRDAQPGAPLWASATSSSRTLLAWEQEGAATPFFIKVSLDRDLGGVRRNISGGEVARSVGTHNVLAHTLLADGFEYLPEVLGAIPKGYERGGQLVRPVPDTILSGAKQPIPLFSLYAADPSGALPLLAQMIRQSGETPQEFVLERLLIPFVHDWFEMAVFSGVIDEPHAQNVLVLRGKDGLPDGRFLHRDLGGFNVDFDFRAHAGLYTPESLPVVTTRENDYHFRSHEKCFRHLRTYFVGGFVYNLEQEFPKWARAGWVNEAPEPGALRREMANELSSLHDALVGEPFEVDLELSQVPALVKSARAALVAP